MKSHISATIDSMLVRELEEYSAEEQRSRSQVIERALSAFLAARRSSNGRLVTSSARFDGTFERGSCYDR